MDKVRNGVGKAPVFVLAYLVFMLPTYLLPYAGSNSLMFQGFAAAAGAHWLGVPTLLHIGAMLVLCFLCRVRGAYIAKTWLVIFPVLALVFDFVPGLSAIPLVPTVMHLLAVILGVVGEKAATVAS